MNLANGLKVAFVALLLALLPAVAHAQGPDDEQDDLTIRISGDAFVTEAESVGGLIVIDGNVQIDGEVRDSVVVIDGNLIVSGTVGDHITVIHGDVELQRGARVHDVRTISGDINKADGASITGKLRERDNFDLPSGFIAALSVYFWFAITLFVVVCGLVFAAVGGEQLKRAAETMTSGAVNAIVGAVFLWIALPILTGLIFITLIAIPLGLAIFVVVLPTMLLLGYITAGARLGAAVLGRFDRQPGDHPYLAVSLGLVILQVLLVIPFLGWLIAAIAGLWGGGALAHTAFVAARGKTFQGTPTSPATPAT
jgi:hypothetical protein